MAPHGCLTSSPTVHLCMDAAKASNPPPNTASASGKSNFQIFKDLPSTIRNLRNMNLGNSITGASNGLLKEGKALVRRTQVYQPNYGLSVKQPEPTEEEHEITRAKYRQVYKIVFPIIAVLVVGYFIWDYTCCLQSRGEKKRDKETHKLRLKHDYEYRSQDRVNKSLRWKTLKKCLGMGQAAPAKEGAVARRERERREKERLNEDVEKGLVADPADIWWGGQPRPPPREDVESGLVPKRDELDVETMKGIAIAPMKDWSITSVPPSIEQAPKPTWVQWFKSFV